VRACVPAAGVEPCWRWLRRGPVCELICCAQWVDDARAARFFEYFWNKGGGVDLWGRAHRGFQCTFG